MREAASAKAGNDAGGLFQQPAKNGPGDPALGRRSPGLWRLGRLFNCEIVSAQQKLSPAR